MNLGALTAIAGRELRLAGRSRAQLASTIVTPLLFLVLIGVGVSRGLEPTTLSDGDFIAYLVAGVAVMVSVFAAVFSGAAYYRDRDSGLLRTMLAAPVPPRTILAGKSLAGVVIATSQSLVVVLLAAPFVEFEWQHGVLVGIIVATAAIGLLNVILGGFGAMLATRVSTMQAFHLVMNVALFPLLFFSGAFFPLDGLPTWFRVLTLVNPLTYAVDGLQQALYASTGSGYIGLGVDFAVLGLLAVIATGGGFARIPRLTWSGQ